jgi:hypothetical protein
MSKGDAAGIRNSQGEQRKDSATIKNVAGVDARSMHEGANYNIQSCMFVKKAL